MEPRYRADYPGEFVVTTTTWTGGKKIQDREWIENPIKNQHISGRAACLGSSIDRDKFNYTILERHRGGLLGSKKLQTYGTGEIALEMRLDFTVETNNAQLTKLVEQEYQVKNIVYTTAKNCLTNPGEFYLLPQAPRLSTPALAVYLSAFDEHKEIFLIGYHRETPYDNPRWIGDITKVIQSYSGVKFHLVGEPSLMPDEWLDCPNTRAMPVRDFISYADV
jgi:hypothetical protein